MNKHFCIIFLALFCVSSCSSLDPNSNFVCLYDSQFSYDYGGTFGVEYPKYAADKNNIFDIKVMTANFNYYYIRGGEPIKFREFEEIYFFVDDFERDTLYKLNIDPVEFSSEDFYINPHKIKYDNFKHKYSINLNNIIDFDYSNFIYIGMKLLNDNGSGYSFDVSYRFNFTNIESQIITLDNLFTTEYKNIEE